MTTTIRLATAQDAAQVLAIYAPIVRATVISFELDPPTVDEMGQRITGTLARLPWLVCEQRGEILGYAYANPQRAGAAYQWTVEVSVYVHIQHQRAGIGRAVYTALFQILALQGFCHAYAGIALPNPASVGVHAALGFQPVGVYRQSGYKLGAWHDVGWWYLALRPATSAPQPPVNIWAVHASDAWEVAITAGLARLRIGRR